MIVVQQYSNNIFLSDSAFLGSSLFEIPFTQTFCLFEMKRMFCLPPSFDEMSPTHSLLFIKMKLSSSLIVPLTFNEVTSHIMYLVPRNPTFAKLFFLLSMCGLIMYAVLAFYTFHVVYTAVTNDERTQQKLMNYPVPEIIKERSENNMKYILLWTIPDYKFNFSKVAQQTFIDNDCAHLNCYLTTNKSLLGDVTKFDAIVFSINTLKKWKKYLPKKRSPKQKYVFYSMIPAVDYPICNIMADNFFNWTWTYKLYSDIPTPFIEVKDLKGNLVAPSADVEWPIKLAYSHNSSVTKPKAKAMMWHNENCGKRHSNIFAKHLKVYMKEHSMNLDIYGCAEKSCPKEGCLEAIDKYYSFYLAFERSITDDYVSKEVLKGLQHNAVPVVVGGADYTKFLPPGSYIDARYETPERLAGLLEYIIRNPSSYNKYFSWKKYYTINEANIEKGYCQLCSLLNDKERTQTHSSYESFRKWWYYGNLREKCVPKGAESLNEVLSYIKNPEELKDTQ